METEPTFDRPPWWTAAALGGGVLLLLLLSLAPTVTFWDAGELLVAAHRLSIPHPPGTPLFVLIAHLWGLLLPLKPYALSINALSAACSAAASALWFLVVHDSLQRMHADIDPRARAALATLGGVAAAVLATFSFSSWQNANEAEVYSLATLLIALVLWAACQWRRTRDASQSQESASAGGEGPSRWLLLAGYLCAVAIGLHPLALLAAPALCWFAWMVSQREPLLREDAAIAERARVLVLGAVCCGAVGLALASPWLCVVAAILLGAAFVNATLARQWRWSAILVLALLVGASSVLFLYVRAGQHPWLDSGDPSTWRRLLDVLRRSQYPPRTPFDDPTVMHGSGNHGRTPAILLYQLVTYVQYFDWQWAASLGDLARASIPRLAVTLLFASLTVRGAFAQRRADRSGFTLLGTLWLITGPALLLYLNFKPGPSIGWNLWPDLAQHEVRDRDYFFVLSFIACGLWAGIGITDVVRTALPNARGLRRRLVPLLFGVALVPLALNARAAARSVGAERTLARDFAHALLGAAPPHAILFTWGDNDTFPLWYAQQVTGDRPDVTLVSVPLMQTLWYQRQLRDADSLFAWRDDSLAGLRAVWATADVVAPLATGDTARVPRGAAVYPADRVMLRILEQNAGRRPVAWAITAEGALYGLGPRLVQQGMVLVLPTTPVADSLLASGAASDSSGAKLDVANTAKLLAAARYGELENVGPAGLDGNIDAVVDVIARPYRQLGAAMLARGDSGMGQALLRRAVQLGGLPDH